MTQFARALGWFALYVLLIVTPVIVAVVTDPITADRPAILEFSVGVGLLAFSLIVVQFALVSHVKVSSVRSVRMRSCSSTALWDSIPSSAEHPPDGSIEFAIRELGDWSRSVVPNLAPGDRVWVDGAFGPFTTERKAAQGFVMIAAVRGVTRSTPCELR